MAVVEVVVVFVRNGLLAVDLKAHAVSKGFCAVELGGATIPIEPVPLVSGLVGGGE